MRIRELLQQWLARKRCTKRELLSVAGQLQHAASVVRSGRTFLRWLFDLSKMVRNPDHQVQLTAGARSDLAWWHTFLIAWNGISLMTAVRKGEPQVMVTFDASGSWGCGAFCVAKWFQLAWSEATGPVATTIAVKKLIPILIAAAVWSREWQGKVVGCRCDNQAVVAVLRTRTRKDAHIMHLLRCLFFFEAAFSFHIQASHIAGALNTLANDISRNNLPSILQTFCFFPLPSLHLFVFLY